MRFDPNLVRTPEPMPWSLIEGGLWIRFGIAGGAVAAASPFLALAGEASPAASAIAFIAGAALAALSYRRARKLLGVEDVVAAAPAIARGGVASAHAA